MVRKILWFSSLCLVYLGLVGFSPAEDSELVWNGPVGWTAFAIVLAVILVVSILLIIQSHQTPAKIAVYHLDHPGEGHAGHEAHATAGEEPAAVMEHRAVEAGTAEGSLAEQPVIADDLTKIEGIGPKINELLNRAGITTFAQLAEADLDHLRTILREAGPRFSLADPTSWKDQARLAQAGDWEAFKALTERLRAGRSVE